MVNFFETLSNSTHRSICKSDRIHTSLRILISDSDSEFVLCGTDPVVAFGMILTQMSSLEPRWLRDDSARIKIFHLKGFELVIH